MNYYFITVRMDNGISISYHNECICISPLQYLIENNENTINVKYVIINILNISPEEYNFYNNQI